MCHRETTTLVTYTTFTVTYTTFTVSYTTFLPHYQIVTRWCRKCRQILKIKILKYPSLIPLKNNSKLIGKYGMDNPVDVLSFRNELPSLDLNFKSQIFFFRNEFP